MKNLGKRFLSMLLVALMIVSVMPFTKIKVDAADIEKAYFPMKTLNISNGYKATGKTQPHKLKYAVDACGNDSGKDVVYAPFTGYIKKTGTTSGTCVLESKNKVQWANGTVDYMHIMLYHCENLNEFGLYVGKEIKQGQAFYREGAQGNATGNHIHLEVGKGKYPGNEIGVTSSGGDTYDSNLAVTWRLKEQVAPDKGLFIKKDTKILNTGKISWVKDNESPHVPTPGTPSLSVDASNIAVGKNIKLTWSAASNAEKYTLFITGAETKEIKDIKTTSKDITLNAVGKYNFYVVAYNSAGVKGSPSGTISCTTHAPCTVTVMDYDGKEKEKITVAYGGSVSLNAPSRDGYTFQGWDKSTKNITSDITITPEYKINTYTVNFWGLNDSQPIKTQKVNYGENATPPTNITAPEGYEFVTWDSEEYKNVFTRADDKAINVYAIYKLEDEDIPIVCEITSAYRDAQGYHVVYNLENRLNKICNGRAIISLKTAEGKLIHTTESKSFSLQGISYKANIDEFFECQQAATVIEIIIVDSYSSGIPLSKKATATVENGLGWSDWADGSAPEGVEAEERVLYSFRNKETKKTDTNVLAGWELIDSSSSVGEWSEWSTSASVAKNTPSLVRDVKTETRTIVTSTQTSYQYYHWYKSNGGNHTWEAYDHKGLGGYKFHPYTTSSPFATNGKSECTGVQRYKGPACTECNTGSYWYYNKPIETPVYEDVLHYSYRDTVFEYTFSRWGDWSDWSETKETESDTKQVQTKTQYRTNSGVEDTSGITLPTKKYYVGTEFAGKQATLFIYKFDAPSDYTDEYVGQVEVDDDGYCTFENIKLREEPSIKTGDMTFALGIAGTTNTFVVETLEAPVPTYTVTFYDGDGTLLETQTVKEGESAVLPATTPSREGYDFLGWSESLTNIKCDMDIFPEMERKTYQVVFVDWESQFLQVSEFKYGDVLITPEHKTIDGHTFKGWDQVISGNSIVTGNMVISPVYEKNSYTVNFYDFDGNIIDSQVVEYGESAMAPDLESSEDGKLFAGWYNSGSFEFVESDAAIYPSYYFEESAEIPTASYETGEYNEAINVTLSSTDENAVIYYCLSDNMETETLYTGPITIDKTTTLTFYATSIGKNNSEPQTNYYCINKKGDYSNWMPYDALPDYVKNNPEEYPLESQQGYRYKTFATVSRVDERDVLLANDDWTLQSRKMVVAGDFTNNRTYAYSDHIDSGWETRMLENKTYMYSHYHNGQNSYAPYALSGYPYYREIKLNYKLSVAGTSSNFGRPYYIYNNMWWYNEQISTTYQTQYRPYYYEWTYYRWLPWCLDEPTDESTEYEITTLYRYDLPDQHVVTINSEFQYELQRMIIQNGLPLNLSDFHLDGYEATTLYTDAEMTKPFEINTPITESVTLYVKYEPKEYTVIFQTDGGFEFDVQKVKYMEAATEPDVFNMPGYVFSKWDKDFSCITEDTVVTGKYYKESEYARISLNSSIFDMYQGNNTTLTYTITPADLSGEAVEWSSSNPEVVTVNDKGKITALSPGESTITVKVLSTGEISSCVVTVNEDAANFIVIKEESALNHDSLGYLRRIGFNTTVESAAVNFRNNNLEFYNIDGTLLTNSSVIGTGTTIVLKNGENVLDKETIVVTGDMTGDGLLNNRDVAMVNRYLVNKVTPQECQIVALDLNGDGYINNKDAAMAARYLVGKDAII